ncbi:MAG: hypothetical protein IJ001_09030 [Oscillospiraceae bacterium]|nr:hypothetical protein [Oscillospiraceae bacterium]
MKLKNTHKYDDIIHLPHPVSQRRSRMTNYDRAAQFSPFAALTGYDAVIEETARLTDSRIELDQGAVEQLNERLLEIRDSISSRPLVTLTWFRRDERKAGGAYIRATGRVKKIDSYTNTIVLTDGTVIPIRELADAELL